jgi:glyoxylase-like metal-dependent hydrolase (beta-lactamase superfamily II)
MTTVHLLHPGYVREEGTRVGSSVTFIRDGDALIVADPGLVANRRNILDPLAALGVEAAAVTHVFLSHHHPDHTMNAGLFENAEVVDFWARYRDDLWLDHGGDGWRMTPHTQLWLTPGHSEEDATLIVEADDGVYALTHLWWQTDRSPAIDPYCPDQALLDFHRERVLAAVDIVIPGHGEAFRTRP